jgi:hypothetical protein
VEIEDTFKQGVFNLNTNAKRYQTFQEYFWDIKVRTSSQSASKPIFKAVKSLKETYISMLFFDE